MIRFIDITTGNVFNGSQPYVFWFDKEQSVNLNYVRKICVLSTDEHLIVSLPDNPIFCLLDTSKMGEDIELSGKKFKDLDNSGFKTLIFNSTGAPYNSFYVHMLYILGKSPEAGEYRETLTIGGEEFMIGADFYNEREELSINLTNQGFEMPKLVEKAIYEFNVHEEGIDNILLNRKYKELLSEYINILGNKGSYKSLINSLKWFEYGDLISILDYWKHEEPTRSILSSNDIKQVADNNIEDILTKFHKTTYIGLYLALTKVAQDAGGNIEYVDSVKYWDDAVNKQWGETWESATTQKLLHDVNEAIITDPTDRLLQIGEDHILVDDYTNPIPSSDKGSNWKLLDKYFDEYGHVITKEVPEPVPAIDFAAAKWSAIDLSLKMTLLGNFFSTYFMPLHLDLIHSTVENIVYANTVKFFTWHILHRQDWNHDIESFSCDVEEDKYFMTDVKARVYPDTTFGESSEDIIEYIILSKDNQDYRFYRNITKDIFIANNHYCAWDYAYILNNEPTTICLYTSSSEPLPDDVTYSISQNTVTETEYVVSQYVPNKDIFGVDDKDRETYISSIVVDGATLDRNESKDCKNISVDYYAWGDYFTLNSEPKIGDAVYEYDLLSGFMEISGSVEDVVESGGYAFDEDTVKTYLSQRFEGPGVIIPFQCILHKVQHGMYITEASIMMTHDGVDRLYHTYNVHNDVNEVNALPDAIQLSNEVIFSRDSSKDINYDGTMYYSWGDYFTLSESPLSGDSSYKYEDEMILSDYVVVKSIYKGDRHIDFNILLQDEGDYQFAIDFKCGNGMHYIKTFKFSVYDDTRQEVKMYKIVRRDWDELQSMLEAPQDDLIKFMFTQLDQNDSLYRQFLAVSDQAFRDKIGLNQVIIYEPRVTWNNGEANLSYYFKFGKNELTCEGVYDDIESDLTDYIDLLNRNHKYRFFLQDRLGLRKDDIINDFQPDDDTDPEDYTVDNWDVIKYNNSQNIAYLYNIVRRHEDESGIERYYTIIPYIFGICIQPDISKSISLCKNKSVGVVKGNKKDIIIFDLYLNINGMQLVLDSNKPKGVVISALRYSSDRELIWKEFDRKLPDRSIVDNQVRLRFYFPNTNMTKEVVIDVPRLMNLSYWISDYTEEDLYKQVYTKDGKIHEVSGWYENREIYVSPNKVEDKDITNISERSEIGRLFLQHKFIPLFHKLTEVPNRTIANNDVVCFLPDLKMVRNDKYNSLGWKFYDATTHHTVEPKPYQRKNLYWDDPEANPDKKDKLVDPLEPMLGRYDLKTIIDPGYYNIELEYELVTDHNVSHKYISNSEFIVEK